MKPLLDSNFANPSSLYAEGVESKKIMENARKRVAKILSAHADEIIFTSGGTEANNLALLGLFQSAKTIIKKPQIIITNIEHPSIMEVCSEIKRRGGKVKVVRVEANGIVDPKKIKKAITNRTILVSVMYANNEVGTIQPIREIAKVIRQFRKTDGRNQQLFERLRLGQTPRSGLSKSSSASPSTFPYLHTDASQAANYLDLNVERLGVDLMTIDGTKIYGPRGAGFLVCRRRTPLWPIIFGGGQESGRRAGTENPPAALGLATALEISQSEKKREAARLCRLRDYFISEIRKHFPKAILNGDAKERLPNNVNFCFPDLDAEFAVLQLDAKGIAISSVTSCQNLNTDSSSYVVQAIQTKNCQKSSLRFSFGRKTTKKNLDFCLEVLYSIINGRAH